MNDSDNQRARELFGEAVELDEAARKQFLDEACGDNLELRQEIESLLVFDTTRSDLFETNATTIRKQIAGMALGLDDDASMQQSHPIPSRLGKYRPIRVIGEGGMGIVYEAEQQSPNRRIALKMIHVRALNQKNLQRLRFEAELLGRLQHPGIAQIYEAGTIDDGEGGRPFIAMELIDGLPLTKYAASKSLSSRDKLALFVQVCDAVQHAHQQGIIHRDLKPENVLVDHRGQARVLDFGIARLDDPDIAVTTIVSAVGSLIGTVPYMSPEQISGRTEDLDVRSDVFTLGVMLFELLCERLPHDIHGCSLMEAARIISEANPLRLSSIATVFRGDLDVIVAKAMEKSPERRYQSAEALGADIQRYLDSKPIYARPPSRLYEFRRLVSRNKALFTGISVAMLALTIGLIVSIHSGNQARSNAAAADWANYQSQMQNASAALSLGHSIAARDALEAAPSHLDGWERDHITSRLSPAILSQTNDNDSRWFLAHWNPSAGPRAIEMSDTWMAVVDLTTNTPIARVEKPAHLCRAAVSGDGRQVVLHYVDEQKISVLEADGFKDRPILTPPINPRAPHPSLDLSGDRMAYAHRGDEVPKIVVIDVQSGALLLEVLDYRENSALHKLSPDGRQLALCTHEGFQIWDIESGESRKADALEVATSIAWSNDGAYLALASAVRQKAVVYDAQTLEPVLTTPRVFRPPTGVFFSPDSSTFAVSYVLATDLWNLESGSLVCSVAGPSVSAAFEPGGSRIVTIDGARAQVFNSGTLDLPQLAADPNPGNWSFLYLAAFSPDGSVVATSGLGDIVYFWDTLENQLIGSLWRVGVGISSLSFTDDGLRLFTYAHRRGGELATFWNCTMGVAADVESEPLELYWSRPGGTCKVASAGVCKARSNDGTLIAHGRAVQSDKQVATLLSEYETDDVVLSIPQTSVAVAISRDNRMLATSTEQAVVLWDIESGERIGTCDTPSGELVYSLVFDDSGRRLVGGGRSGLIHFWDTKSCDVVCQFDVHEDYVHHVAFSDDGTRLVSASGDGSARLFDTVSGVAREAERLEARARREAMSINVASWRQAGVDESEIARRLERDAALTTADRRRLFAEIPEGHSSTVVRH